MHLWCINLFTYRKLIMSIDTIYIKHNCNFCKFTSTKIKTFRRHVNVCANNPSNNHKKFKCVPCNIVYSTNANLSKHNNTCEHNANKTIQTCNHCNYETYSNSGITNHIHNCVFNPINKEKYNTEFFIKNYNVNKSNIFLDNKYTKIYYRIINSVTPEELMSYCENHHILPRSMGGSDDTSNIARISARKHFICHLLLTKMVDKNSPYYYKMVNAFMMMKANQKYRYMNSKLYNDLRTEFSKAMSITTTKNNIGSIWVHCPINKTNHKIKKDGIIPDCYIKGQFKKPSIKFGICKYCNKEFIKTSHHNIRCNKNCKAPIMHKSLYDSIMERTTIVGDCVMWNLSSSHNGPQYIYEGKNIQIRKYIFNTNKNDYENFVIKTTCHNDKCINSAHLIAIKEN